MKNLGSVRTSMSYFRNKWLKSDDFYDLFLSSKKYFERDNKMRSLKGKLEIDLTFFSFSIVPTYIATYTVF